jgi:hypothetical protein
MKSEIDKIYLIDRFLKGELSGLPLDEFKNKMRTDKEFAQEVESQKAIIEGIKMARREQLISIIKSQRTPETNTILSKASKIKESENTFKIPPPIKAEPDTEIKEFKLRPNYNNWHFAVAAVLLSILGFYFIFGYYIPHQKLEVAYQDSLEAQNNNLVNNQEKESETTNKPLNNDGIEKNDSLKQNQQLVQIAQVDSLKIEKDAKISETLYSVAAFETITPDGANTNTNVLTGETNDDLRVSNVRKVKGTSVKVEFWQSVVNFKGYKLNGNKLLLFDIKRDENVNLKFLDNQLYLKKNGYYYKLNGSETFETYKKETNIEIIKTLESN